MYIKDPIKINENYKIRFFSVFKNREPHNYYDIVPYMNNTTNLNEGLKINFLNYDGILAMKELMWLLNSVIPNI